MPDKNTDISQQKTGSYWGISRRKFIKQSLIYGAGFTSFVGSLILKPQYSLPADAPVEYIVIGSGAGGGPLACNLAKAGHKVVLFEAGADDKSAANPSDVPFFTAATSEYPPIQWDYYVRHYSNLEQQKRDTKYYPEQDGVWYPRVGALGGCTVHSFLVEIYPSNSDWDYIAQITKDPSWKSDNMRKYFERFEQCRYVPRPIVGNPTRHGFDGWQTTEIPDPSIYKDDQTVQRILRSAAKKVFPYNTEAVLERYRNAKLDPNEWRLLEYREGMYNIPQFMDKGKRRGPRELIRETQAALPNNLIVKTNCLVTRILLDANKTAIGVEYIEKPRLYRADPNYDQNSTLDGKQQLNVTREVIVSAGAFNSPQLLMLSGIGPAEELSKHGIPQLVNLPGVGKNLQDRYEVGVITEVKPENQLTFAQKCTFFQTQDDPCAADWALGKGVYSTVGAVTAIMMKSKVAAQAGRRDPDLFIFSAASPFKGYYRGYSGPIASTPNQFTWAILKAHTLNNAGTVTLRSPDPRDTPIINFRYFEEGSDPTGEDLKAVVEGVQFVRGMNRRPEIKDIAVGEVWPDPKTYPTTSPNDTAQFVRDEAWGHHASCTNKMGPKEDPMAVVDSNFRVHGTKNLRIVDASVFPKIPGYFILTPIFMISEKASDVILADAK
ncbi:GMC family oxidoreductase [Calothrix membranacea FACHB-236]|nr:GMC family oxidoreductase [Calothrix membranacea FACHB-236]